MGKKLKSSRLIRGGRGKEIKPAKKRTIINDIAEVQELAGNTGFVEIEAKPGERLDLIEEIKSPQECPVYQIFPDAASSTASPTFLADSYITRDDFMSEMPDSGSYENGEGGGAHPSSSLLSGDEELEPWEIVVDKNGLPRQAGATMPEGEFVKRYKKRAEENLFIFLKGVLGRFFLTPHFHRSICKFIQTCPPFRKLVLMPREHAKTTIVAGGLPPHILIQPKESNIYFPGLEGSECRILLAGETETMAKKNLRVVQSIFEENKLFRAFWPHRCWDGGKGKVWSSEQMIIPRGNEWPDPTIRAIGVGGAVTGARPNVMIKDDLVSFKAANSDTVMDEAIEWHKASRALLDKYEVESGLSSLEFLIGTRWAVFDLYSYIQDNDPSVEINPAKFHKIINDGRILWPEKYTKEDIEQLQREHGSNFYLLYLNSAADPELTDFDMMLLRDFMYEKGMIIFEEDDRDERLMKKLDMRIERMNGNAPPVNIKRGEKLTGPLMQKMFEAGGGFRMRGI